jgi:hypothetical protein
MWIEHIEHMQLHILYTNNLDCLLAYTLEVDQHISGAQRQTPSNQLSKQPISEVSNQLIN